MFKSNSSTNINKKYKLEDIEINKKTNDNEMKKEIEQLKKEIYLNSIDKSIFNNKEKIKLLEEENQLLQRKLKIISDENVLLKNKIISLTNIIKENENFRRDINNNIINSNQLNIKKENKNLYSTNNNNINQNNLKTSLLNLNKALDDLQSLIV